MIEEQHVSQYESLKNPNCTWLENWFMHEYTECYLYYSMKEQETCPEIKQIWEEHFQMEVAHLKLAAKYLKEYEGKEVNDLLRNQEFPKLLVFNENKEYVRKVIEDTIYNTAYYENYVDIRKHDDNEKFVLYQEAIAPYDDMVASHDVIKKSISKLGNDYRFEVNKHPITELQVSKKDNTTVGRL